MSEAALEPWLAEELRRPFPPGSAPLLRASLVRYGARSFDLVVVAHHLVLDGWSWGVLLHDLFTGYDPRGQGAWPAHGPVTQFGEFLDWRAQRLSGPAAEAALDYWRAELADPPSPLALPASHLRPSGRVHAGRRQVVRVGAALYEGLVATAREQGASLAMVLLAAFEALLHRLTDRTDFVVGLPLAGQLAMGCPELIGSCTNVLPVRARVDPDAGFADHLSRVRTALAGVYDNQGVPLAALAA